MKISPVPCATHLSFWASLFPGISLPRESLFLGRVFIRDFCWLLGLRVRANQELHHSVLIRGFFSLPLIIGSREEVRRERGLLFTVCFYYFPMTRAGQPKDYKVQFTATHNSRTSAMWTISIFKGRVKVWHKVADISSPNTPILAPSPRLPLPPPPPPVYRDLSYPWPVCQS